MNKEDFRKLLEGSDKAFEQFEGKTDMTDGWKISIQGNTLDDSVYLFEHLILLLVATKVYFKFATQHLINMEHPQQSHKLLTIYIPNGVDAKSYCELVYNCIREYKGGEGIEPIGYEKYHEGIFFRTDRDANGVYVMPYKPEELKK